MKDGKEEKELGKKRGTTIHNNSLYVKEYERGVTIRKRGEKYELILSFVEAGEVALDLRDYSYPKLFTEIQIKDKIDKIKEYDYKLCLFRKEVEEIIIGLNNLKDNSTKMRLSEIQEKIDSYQNCLRIFNSFFPEQKEGGVKRK